MTTTGKSYVEVRHGEDDHVIIVRSGRGREVCGVLGLLDSEWQSLAAIVRAADPASVTVSREDIRAVVRLARMSRHLAEDPATDRLAAAAGEGSD